MWVIRLSPANRRLFQRRRRRHVRFTAERRGLFLGHFAATADAKAAAAEAGVAISTVTLHRRTDRVFAELCREALAIAYPRLEALVLHIGLTAQARLRHAMEAGLAAGPAHGPAPCPHCGHRPDEAETFDRAMRLLARHDRRQRRTERRFKPGGRRQEWTFERAIAELDQWLKAMGIPIIGEDDGSPTPP